MSDIQIVGILLIALPIATIMVFLFGYSLAKWIDFIDDWATHGKVNIYRKIYIFVYIPFFLIIGLILYLVG